jgi:molybdenum cofactor cytidylyltransferase
MRLGVLILGAGLSRRWRGPNKLMHIWRAKPLIEHVVRLGEAVDAAERIIIVHRDPDSVEALLDLTKNWRLIENTSPLLGLSSSLTLGLEALDACDRVLVLLADMPDVALSTLEALIATPMATDTYAIVPALDGEWGNPVILGRQVMRDCMKLAGDQGARALLLARARDVIVVPTQDPAILRDFDRPEDLTGA